MDLFEKKLSQATALDTRDLSGAIAFVIDKDGTILYQYASGYRSLASDALPADINSTFTMASAGKFITHLAALQLVDRGLIGLDDPVYPHLPELGNLKVLSKTAGPDASATPFLLQPATKKITLRHLLSHSSGIGCESDSPVPEWRKSLGEEPKEDYHPVKNLESIDTNTEVFSTPLLFEPGEGWLYGSSIEWTAALIARLTKQPFPKFIKENIFMPLGMTSSVYGPQDHPDILARLLKLVMRNDDTLVPLDYEVRDLVSSAPDLINLFADLLSPTSKILSKESQTLLFEPQFAPESAARSAIHRDVENYAAPAGIPVTMTEAPVNHSLAALFIEEELPLSKMPAGTVTWNGMPNLIWAINQEKGLAMMFVTQLVPVDDEKTVDIAMEFFRGAWGRFG